MTPRSGRRRLTRDRIVAVALDLIERHGHDALSLRSLAAELEVTAPALYDHVDGKDDLLRAVAVVGYDDLAERSADAARLVSSTATGPSAGAALARCRSGARAYVDYATERPELFRTMLRYRPAAVPADDDNELAAATVFFERGLDDLRQAIADGDLVDRDPVDLSLTIWAATHGVATIALVAPEVAKQVADDVIEAVFTGLRPG
ncbi:MAG: TetR/AcrR family transcriptional regulator [Actinomycetota bacterium]